MSKPKVAVTGASGFIGAYLPRQFEVVPIPRQLEGKDLREFLKNSGVKGVINLAGESIFGRWNKRKKQRIWQSRVYTTRKIVEAINTLPQIGFFISVSGTSLYPDNLPCDESCTRLEWSRFLSQLIERWEQEAFRCNKPTAVVRLGVVLGKDGGFWKRVELPLKMGFYPVVGSGKQWFSYIYVEELINIFRFIFEEKLIGVFNGTTPNPVRIGEVGKIYGEITGKKIRTINIPPSILRPFLGELVDEVLLASPQVIPKHLIEKGYTFRYPSLEDILKTLV
jgi:uncharacterized protein (TIGR01777 family)